MNIQTNEIEKYDLIDSIDEAAEKLDRSMETNQSIRREITPEVEFWGHCSNIQAWAENDYDTRLLHRNLAFPLLKELMNAGDPLAKRVFKEEIAIRITSKHPTVISYLLEQGYLKYLNQDEIQTIFDEIKLPIIEKTVNMVNRLMENEEISIKRRILNVLSPFFNKFGHTHIPFIFSKIKGKVYPTHREKLVKLVYNKYKTKKSFSKVKFINHNIEYFSDKEFAFVKYNKKVIGIIQEEEILDLTRKKIKDINKINGLEKHYEKIKELDLSNNLITNLRGIEKFKTVKKLNLDNNLLQQIESITSLTDLEILSLKNNQLSNLKGIEGLKNLKTLNISGNKHLFEIPEVLNTLPNLEDIKLWDCDIKTYTDSTSSIFWGHQNYRFFKGFGDHDIEYYETTHPTKALSPVDGFAYKKFVEWVLKIKKKMKKYNFSYEDIEAFNTRFPSLQPIWSGRLTNTFKKLLDDKNQRKITEFF
jgi:hypothetical protein